MGAAPATAPGFVTRNGRQLTLNGAPYRFTGTNAPDLSTDYTMNYGCGANNTTGLGLVEVYDLNRWSDCKLANISTRGVVQSAENVLIGGFILGGTNGNAKVLLRAIGPSLTANSQPLPGRLLDPTLTLYDGAGNALFSNDDWMNSSQKQAIIDSTVAPTDPKESAIIATLQPGNYTAIMSGVGTATGIGVVELYDLDQSAPANPANIATRGFVESGDNVMIGGFIVGGSQNRVVLVRAIGPSLTAVGVPNALQDPTLELHNGSGTTIASNDNWKSDQQAQISATGLAPSDDREAAILSTPLTPGNYTAVVRGSGTNTGVALVEIYQLQ